VWTPDGQRVVFSVGRDAAENVYWQPADGSRPAEPLTNVPSGTLAPRTFSPDGAKLIVGSATPPFDLQLLQMNGERRLEPLLTSSFDETDAAISPDGRWLAYQSNESGRFEIYVRPFPDINSGRWMVSNGGGTRPVWSHSGRELFHSAAQSYGPAETSGGILMSVPVQTGQTFSFGSATRVVNGSYVAAQAGRHYDVSSEGRFLMIKSVSATDTAVPAEIIVVQNWFEEVKRLVP
jgi:serine/threonine-protein kinase